MKKKIRIILITLLSFFLYQCDRKNDGQQKLTEANRIKAFAFYEEASRLAMNPSVEKDSLIKSVALLDSAILINPANKGYYFQKIHWLTKLGKYKEALKTIRKIEELSPGSADIKTMAGITHYLNEDAVSGRIKLLEADSLWNLALNTISPQNAMRLLSILSNKALVLKCLGKEEQAIAVLKRLSEEPVSNEYKEMYEVAMNHIDSLFSNRSGEELIEYLLSEIRDQSL